MSENWTSMEFRQSITVRLPNSSVFRHIFGHNISEIQAFCSDFRHFLFGFLTPYWPKNQMHKRLNFLQIRITDIQILAIMYSRVNCTIHNWCNWNCNILKNQYLKVTTLNITGWFGWHVQDHSISAPQPGSIIGPSQFEGLGNH